MKTFAIVFALALASTPMLRAGDGQDYKPKYRVLLETFATKVIKVLSFEDGDAAYNAYLVSWKNHEVVVMSNFVGGKAAPKFKVGDEITCFLQQRYNLDGDSTKATLSFSIGVLPAGGPTSQDETRRLEAVAAEVRARREEREASASASVPSAP